MAAAAIAIRHHAEVALLRTEVMFVRAHAHAHCRHHTAIASTHRMEEVDMTIDTRRLRHASLIDSVDHHLAHHRALVHDHDHDHHRIHGGSVDEVRLTVAHHPHHPDIDIHDLIDP